MHIWQSRTCPAGNTPSPWGDLADVIGHSDPLVGPAELEQWAADNGIALGERCGGDMRPIYTYDAGAGGHGTIELRYQETEDDKDLGQDGVQAMLDDPHAFECAGIYYHDEDAQ